MQLDLLAILLQAIFTLLFAAIGSLILWLIIGPRVVTQAIQAKLGPILVEWFNEPIYDTGKMRKVATEDGDFKEVKEILSPLELIITKSGELLYQKIYGKLGGDARKKQAVQNDILEGIANPSSPIAGMLNQVNPALLNRAIKDGDYVPIILEQLGPLFAQYLESKLNKSTNSSVAYQTVANSGW